MKKLTGAQVVALGGDAAALEAGQDNSAGGFRGMLPVHVDRVIKDGDTVTLGGVTLRALWVPGHTQGATVWMTTVQKAGRPTPSRSAAVKLRTQGFHSSTIRGTRRLSKTRR